MSMSSLATVPERVAAADQLVAALDECFLSGFARLGPDQRETLASVGRTFAGTPLAGTVGEAIAAMSGGGVATEPHMVALAAAREALGGARHDALLAQAVEALGGAVAAPEPDSDATPAAPSASGDADPAVANLMTSVRHWLHELALAGLAQLDVQTIAPFAATLEAVQAQPALGRLAALLTGFVDELMENAPTAAMDQVPARRWVDLWSRAMLVARALPAAPAGREVSGDLRVLGADIRHHDHVATLIAYGTLRMSGEPIRIVRVAISCWKVDAVGGDEVWTAFESAAKELLTALADHKVLAVSRMQLLPTGDLVWTGTAKPTAGFDPIDTALEALAPGAGCAIPTPAPLDRHPVQLAVPVAIAEATFGNANGAPCIELDGAKLPFAPTSPFAGVEFTSLRKTRQLFGLLRHDGARWAFQPLVGKSGSKYIGPGEAIARGRKLRGGTMSVLQDRASVLLRK